MFESIRAKLHNLRKRISTKKEEQTNSFPVSPPFQEEDEFFELTTSKRDNVYYVEISDYIKITNYVQSFKENDPYNLYNSISNNILWNSEKQRVNKGTYFIIYDGNRIYNVLVQDYTIRIDERTQYEDGKVDEKILFYNPETGLYKYSSLKHDETGSTYFTKFYNKNGGDMKYFRLSFDEAFNDISALISNLQITPGASSIVNINMLIEGVLQDMEKTPSQLRLQ